MNKNQYIKVIFPVWQYLNQPLYHPDTVINPFKYWQKYRLYLLEYCWNIESIQLLEKCWKI
ncbi:hypothetical protein RIVM261_042700 [Rivularia sp. IAM M-261]|nr:hypothetical protein RIVM261_042700 [Rivularia sp. IAM M-261]